MKPCPFCGKPPLFVQDPFAFIAQCEHCDIILPVDQWQSRTNIEVSVTPYGDVFMIHVANGHFSIDEACPAAMLGERLFACLFQSLESEGGKFRLQKCPTCPYYDVIVGERIYRCSYCQDNVTKLV